MSASTLPKSVQAQQSSNESENWASRAQECRNFINQYKELPDDFLRIPTSCYSNQQQLQPYDAANTVPRNLSAGPLVDMIDISVVEAQLVKNYGLLRMDLYCKIRVGHMVCETQTCPNGAKNPKWDGVYQFALKPGIDTFHLEIYDEKQFSLDEKIAWLYEPIPSEIFQGITVERWFPLSGRSGPNKEGSILLVISHKRVPMRASNMGRSVMSAHQASSGPPMTVFVPAPGQPQIIGGGPPVDPQVNIPTYVQPPPSQGSGGTSQQISSTRVNTVEVSPASEEDVNQLGEMFPSIDKEIIKAILVNNNHDKEAAIGALLAMG